jgi:hypothetical protein
MAIEAVNKEYLVLHFAEFADVDPERITALNETALLFVEEGVFGTKSRYALALMIAHMLKVSSFEGAGGPIISQSVGDLSETFAAPQGKSGLENSSYGQEYMRIARQKSVAFRPLFVQ